MNELASMNLRDMIEASSTPEPNCGCWIWLKGATGNGYASVRVGGINDKGHRVSWRAFRGEIPPGMYVCHRCDNRMCVNPDHLFLGTATDNNHDMMRKSRHRAPRTHGTKHGRAKLDDAKVREIMLCKESGEAAARRYGVSGNLVSRIRRGLVWKHISRADISA